MDGREERIYEEAAELWRTLHGGAEPTSADSAEILANITRTLPDIGYVRICSPHLRPWTITEPKRRSVD